MTSAGTTGPTDGHASPRLGEAIILSGSIGKGHDSVAEACRTALEGAGLPAEVRDCMEMLGGTGARVGAAVFRRLISVPALYDGIHFSHLRNGRMLPGLLERASLRQVLPALRQRMASAPPRPLVVSVFPTGVSATARLKHERPDITAVAVCTDACAHRLWVAEGTDLYVVCSSLAAVTVRRYAPTAPVSVVPPPVRAPFYDAPSMADARGALGLPQDAACVLLMAGGWGLGPLAETAAALADAGFWVLAVAGLNRALHARLRAVAESRPRVVAFSMTDQVPELMAAANGVVTSAGQTCNEARVVGRWLVVLDVVPGHGRENTLHELELGGALSCSPDPGAVVAAARLMAHEQPAVPPWPMHSAADWEKAFFGALAGAGIDPHAGRATPGERMGPGPGRLREVTPSRAPAGHRHGRLRLDPVV
jgi:processive 1,2-diacylglycerol beta-glucosyltransferase